MEEDLGAFELEVVIFRVPFFCVGFVVIPLQPFLISLKELDLLGGHSDFFVSLGWESCLDSRETGFDKWL